IGAVVPFEHDRFRLVAGDDVHVSEEALVGLKREALGSAVEPVAVRAQSWRLGVRRFVMCIAVPLPGAVRGGAGGKLLVEPEALRTTRGLTLPARRGRRAVVEH